MKNEVIFKEVVWDQQSSPTPRINLPCGATPLAVGMQGSRLMVWFHVPDTSDIAVESWLAHVAGTGHDLPVWVSGHYVGTVQQENYVWHVFMKKDDGE